MPPTTARARARRTLILCLLLLSLLAGVGILAFKAVRATDTNFALSPLESGWIMPGMVMQTTSFSPQPTRCDFHIPFTINGSHGQPIKISIQSLTDRLSLALDGQPLQDSATEDHVTYLNVAQGPHTLTITATRAAGLPALRFHILDASSRPLVDSTSPAVSYTINGSLPAIARPIDSPWIADGRDPMNAGDAAVWGSPRLTGFIALVSLLGLAAGFILLKRQNTAKPFTSGHYSILVVIVGVVWSLLLLNAWSHLNPDLGFDLSGHLDYIIYVHHKGTVPLANQGWQMYQAPLYYYLAAGLMYLTKTQPTNPITPQALRVLHGLNLVLALGFLAAAAAALRNFAGPRLDRAAIGFVLLAFCPVSFYLFCYPTNENSTTFLVACVFWALSRLHAKKQNSLKDHAVLGLFLGLALLSKLSALLLIAPIAAFFVFRILPQSRPASVKPLLPPAVTCIAALVLCSGYYGYVWANLGSPFVGNWDAGAAIAWWQMPGLRSLAACVPTLNAFQTPFFAGFSDIWSGFWSTLSGDALAGGMSAVDIRPGWNDALFPCTLIGSLAFVLLAGAGIFLRVHPFAGRLRRHDFALLMAILFSFAAFLVMTITVPSYAQAKAFYAAPILLPAAFFAAIAVHKLARKTGRSNLSPAALALIMLPWTLPFVAMFTIVPSDHQPYTQAAWLTQNGAAELAAVEPGFKNALALNPDNWPARIRLARILAVTPGRENDALALIDIQALNTPGAPQQAIGPRLTLLAILLAKAGQTQPAIETLSQSISQDPSQPEAWVLKSKWLKHLGDPAAQETARAGLVFHPWNKDLQALALP